MVTARFNVLQYERTIQMLKDQTARSPFNRKDESKQVLEFLDEVAKDFTPISFAEKIRRERANLHEIIESHQTVSNEGFSGVFAGAGSDDEEPEFGYSRNETIEEDDYVGE